MAGRVPAIVVSGPDETRAHHPRLAARAARTSGWRPLLL